MIAAISADKLYSNLKIHGQFTSSSRETISGDFSSVGTEVVVDDMMTKVLKSPESAYLDLTWRDEQHKIAVTPPNGDVDKMQPVGATMDPTSMPFDFIHRAHSVSKSHTSEGYTPRSPKDLIIPWEQLTLRNKIGSGSFANVYHGLYNSAPCAIKIFKNEVIDQIDVEINVLSKLKPHPNIVVYFGHVEEPDHICLVTEYLAGGSVADLIYSDRPISFTCQLEILRQAACGINHLHGHEPPIVHRDIACRNLLLNADYSRVVVCDFGMSRSVHNKNGYQRTETTTGPCRWMAPESMRFFRYSPQSDIFSFACTVVECLKRQLPYETLKSNYEVIVAVSREGKTPQVSEEWPPELISTLKSCWLSDASTRPKISEILDVLDQLVGFEEAPLSQMCRRAKNPSSGIVVGGDELSE